MFPGSSNNTIQLSSWKHWKKQSELQILALANSKRSIVAVDNKSQLLETDS